MPRNDGRGKCLAMTKREPPNEEKGNPSQWRERESLAMRRKGRPRNDLILVIASEAKQSEGLDFQLRTSFRCRLDCFLLDV